MRIKDKFECFFSIENLTSLFKDKILTSGATGIDNLAPVAFKEQSYEQIEIVSRKVLSGVYSFSKYKLKLVSKGKGKSPREISIPTVRDRIALRALNDFLSDVFSESLNIELPQNVIKKVKRDLDSNKYSGFIKLDVSNFYPSLKHGELLSRLKKRIKDEVVLSTVKNAISSPTVTLSRNLDLRPMIGVPQGLAVSNILAQIYMINIDRRFERLSNISYFRYVDDILIFCDFDEANNIAIDVAKRFSRLGLKIHDPNLSPDKSSINKINFEFSYLGYQFSHGKVSVRHATVEKLKSSIAAIFTSHKYSNIKDESFLLWRLDLRITGCIFEGKSRGWLFFFSEINDDILIHQLDYFVLKLIKRFNVKIQPKKFSRAFKEILHNRYGTKYVPNFDKFSTGDKLSLLTKYFPSDVDGKTLLPEQIDYFFSKRIKKQVKDLLEDVKDFGY